MFRSINKVSIAVCLTILAGYAKANPNSIKELYWASKSAKLQMDAGEKSFTIADTFQKILRVTTPIDCSYYVDPVVRVVPGDYYDMDCGGQSGKGSSALWDAFYSAKKELKVSKLNDAIKGVGDATAKRLYDGKYFDKKPRSWDEFKGAINKAVAEGAIDNNTKTLILSTYRKENMSNLGYTTDSCKVVVIKQDIVEVITPGYSVQKVCPVVDETVVDQRTLKYEISVSNAAILPSEIDEMDINLSGDPAQMSISEGRLNKYQITRVTANGLDSYSVQVSGIARKQVALPNQAVTAVDLSQTSNSSAVLNVNVLPYALPLANERLVLQYEVRSCAPGFLPCYPSLAGATKKTGSVDIKSTATQIQIGPDMLVTPGKKGMKVYVEIKLSKQNSPFHTAKEVNKETKTIEIR